MKFRTERILEQVARRQEMKKRGRKTARIQTEYREVESRYELEAFRPRTR